MKLEEEFQKNTNHIMFLTLSEAEAEFNQLLNLVDPIATYASDIKRLSDGVKNVRKLVCYYNKENKIVYNLRGLGIKAIIYTFRGVKYVKIFGYAGVLDYCDRRWHISGKVKSMIKQGMQEQQKIVELNLKNQSPFMLSGQFGG